MEGFGKWILILLGIYVGWRFLNGWLNSNTNYAIQSSNYISPSYPQVPYGYAGAQFGVVGWGNQGDGYRGWSGQGGWYRRPHAPRVGEPGGSARW